MSFSEQIDLKGIILFTSTWEKKKGKLKDIQFFFPSLGQVCMKILRPRRQRKRRRMAMMRRKMAMKMRMKMKTRHDL